jgi:hypothetical protein
MTIKEVAPVKHSALARFSEKRFNLELTGFEVLSLFLVAEHIGGLSDVRDVFSQLKDNSGLYNVLARCDCIAAAADELRDSRVVTGCIRIDEEILKK